jgi:DNA-binding CsgD family transcriptional regulator
VRSSVEDDDTLLAEAVQQLGASGGFSIAFGGWVQAGTLTLTQLWGNRSERLRGLRVRAEQGLGGRVLAEARPRMTGDYGSSRAITHDFDPAVLSEGIRPLVGAPVVVAGRVRGVLYGGLRVEAAIAGARVAPAIAAAARLARRVEVRDEVHRRLAEFSPNGISPAQSESLRESFAELRAIAGEVTDARLRARINGVGRRLAHLGGVASSPPRDTPRLSPRELDVLSLVVVGLRNTAIASELGLAETTVKAYLSSAMAKLGASSRYEAVSIARRWGIVP